MAGNTQEDDRFFQHTSRNNVKESKAEKSSRYEKKHYQIVISGEGRRQ